MKKTKLIFYFLDNLRREIKIYGEEESVYKIAFDKYPQHYVEHDVPGINLNRFRKTCQIIFGDSKDMSWAERDHLRNNK